MSKIIRNKQNIISIIILVVGTFASYMIFGPHKSHSQVDDQAVTQKPTALVETMILDGDEGSSAKLEKTAIFRSTQSTQVVAEYSGKLTSVDVEVGDYVSEGQVIAVFDQSSSENSAKISLDSAKESLVLSLNNLDKTEKITEESLEIAKNSRKIAEIQLDQAKDNDDDDAAELAERNLKNAKDLEDQAEESSKLQINGAKQQVNQAKSAVEQAQIAFNNTIVKAPIAGLVVSKKVRDDEFISFGQNIGEIVGVGRLETEITLNKNQINRIQTGDEVEIIIEGESAKGEIVSLSPVASSSSARFEVKIQTLKDYSGNANLSGKIIMNLSLDEKIQQNFFIPLEAVNIGQKKTVVFVVIDNNAVSREIEIGEVIGTQVEVISGLYSGDEVVTGNSRNIQEGQSIERNL